MTSSTANAIITTLPTSTLKARPRTTPPAAPINPPGRPLTYFFIRQPGRWVKICAQEINYVEARKNYCKIVTKTGNLLTIVTLKRVAEILPAAEFCQIHRAFIVAVDWVTSFDRASVYGHDQILPIGETYRQALKNRFPLIGEVVRRSEITE